MNNVERGKKIANGKQTARKKDYYQGGKVPFGYKTIKKDGRLYLEKNSETYRILQMIEEGVKLGSKINVIGIVGSLRDMDIKVARNTIYRIINRIKKKLEN